jgi:polyhydroxyalkanoate synthase
MFVDQQTSWFAEQQRTWQRMLSAPRVVAQAREARKGTTGHDVVYDEGTLKLLRYRRETPSAFTEPVLVCYALINRPYILDLQSDKSVVRQYLDRGFDVYMIDWGSPSDADRRLTLEDYVCRFLQNVVEFILREHGRKDLHLLGYCMGGTLSTMFTALNPGSVRTLTLLAAPIDFADGESLLGLWTDPRYFDVDAFIDANGNCPASFLQSCFLLMKPVQNLLEKHLFLFDQMDDPRFVSNFFAMEHWVNDNIPVAGETFRDFVKNLYQSNKLVRGEFYLGHRHVDLRRIRCPLLVLTARNDHLVPPQSTLGILPHVGSPDAEAMTIDAGHVGLVVGGKAHKALWPEAAGWLAARSSSPVYGGPVARLAVARPR